MKHNSLYLEWYINVPELKHDFRSSGIANFMYNIVLGEVDLSRNYAQGNPETAAVLAERYDVRSENVFVSSEGATGQNTRIIRYLAERNRKKNEAIVEYPTYEPLLRQVQEFFPHIKRLERKEEEGFGLDAEALRRTVSEKTSLFVTTNPHAPSGAISGPSELKDIMDVAEEHGFHVLCDEIYAEFDRKAVPTLFSIDPNLGIVTTSFSKAYGLGGLKLGIALAQKDLVDELYEDVLNTVGNSPNVVQLVAIDLLTRGKKQLEIHKQKWANLKRETEKWLNEKGMKHFPSKVGITYWVELPVKDTYRWVSEQTIPRYSLAAVPGAFFLFNSGYKLVETDKVRLSLGGIDPNPKKLLESLEALEKALDEYESA